MRSQLGGLLATFSSARPYLQGVLRSALSPQIETTKATGLVLLPGAMTGLILAGVPPIQAALFQAVVMFLVLAAAATTTSALALGLVRRLFTSDHRLLPLSRSSLKGARRAGRPRDGRRGPTLPGLLPCGYAPEIQVAVP